MDSIVAEHFTDPLSPWCWATQPTVRRLQYAFDDLALVPRLTLLFPTATPAGDMAADDPVGAEAATAAVRSTGMPVTDALWPDGRPSSLRPCAAVAFVRESEPERVDPYLRRVREAAFATGEPIDTIDGLLTLADAVGGIDVAALAAALEDGRAVSMLLDDLERATAVAEALEAGAVETRGAVSRLPLAPRLAAMGEPTLHRQDDAGGRTEESGGDSDNEDESPMLVAPPTIRFETDDRVVVADPRIGYQRLASIGGRAIPDHVESLADNYGTGRLAMHLPRDVAESLSSREFVEEVRACLASFERATLAEIAAGTGRSPETCRGCLQTLVEAGAAEPVGPGETWRMIEGGRPPHPKG